MLRSAVSSWTLFFGLLLIMSGNGIQNVLLGTAAIDAGFSKVTIGIVMSGYFVGMFFGSIFVPKLLSNVGHVRVFGAMSALASAAVLIASLFVVPWVWFAVRIATGFGFAGMYIVSESWLNDKATNQTRGALLSLYMIFLMGGLGLGQLMVGIDFGLDIGLFLMSSVLISIAVLPVLLMAVGDEPTFKEPERMSFRRLLQVSPLAVLGLGLNGVAVSVLFGMGAVFGVAIGLDSREVGYFLTAPVLGCLLLQYPIGSLSDRFDRRLVILGVAVLGGIAAIVAMFFGKSQLFWLLVCMVIYGGSMFPLYSLCIAHANDFLAPSQIVAASSGLVMVNGGGAVIGSPLAAFAVEYFGVNSFFIVVAGIQGLICLVVLYRMTRRASVPNEAQGPFVAIPANSNTAAATLNPEATWDPADDESGEEKHPFHDNPYLTTPPPSQDEDGSG